MRSNASKALAETVDAHRRETRPLAGGELHVGLVGEQLDLERRATDRCSDGRSNSATAEAVLEEQQKH